MESLQNNWFLSFKSVKMMKVKQNEATIPDWQKLKKHDN